MPAPHVPHARRQQEHQEAGRRHHRCAYPPSDVLGKNPPPLPSHRCAYPPSDVLRCLRQFHAGLGDEESDEEEDDKGECVGEDSLLKRFLSCPKQGLNVE